MALDPDNSGVKVLPPLIFLGGLVVGYVLWWFWPIELVTSKWSIAVRVVGLIVAVVGGALVFDAVAWFARTGTSPDPRRPTTKIVDEGPYQFTRNPMYLGMALIMGGLALLGD